MVAQPRPSGQPLPSNRRTPLFAGGRKVASVNHRTGELEESASASSRFLRYPPAIAFSVTVLNAAEQVGAVRVRIRDIESGNVYRAAIQTIREQGTPRIYKGEAQLALPLPMWSCSLGRKPTPTPPTPTTIQAPANGESASHALQQLAFFGETDQ